MKTELDVNGRRAISVVFQSDISRTWSLPLVWRFPGSLERGRRPMESEGQGLLWLGYEIPRSRGQSEICGGRRLGRQRTSIPAQGTRRVCSRVVSSAAFHCCLGLAWLGIAAMPTGKGTCNILDKIGASVCPRFPWRIVGRTIRWCLP